MLGLLLAFALALCAAALLSGLASRTPPSTAVLFLISGFVIGGGAPGVVRFHFIRQTEPSEYSLAFLILILARPTGQGIALLGSALSCLFRLAAREEEA